MNPRIPYNQRIKIMISGGGTGGHVYTAIAIAQALKEIMSEVEILFVGAKGKMEMNKVPEAGFKIIGLWISGIQRKLILKNLSFPLKFISSIVTSFSLIHTFKPSVVVGVGGYASGPLLYASCKKGIPTLIQEQNSYAGLTNKWLSKKVDKICVAHNGMEKYFPSKKLVVTGNPVRKTIKLNPNRINEAYAHFELDKAKPIVLLMGGSLGTRSLNEAVLVHLDAIEKSGVQLIWQCGGYYYREMRERAGKLPKSILLRDFVRQMDFAYAISDVVISRAGALSIAELMLTAKSVILVPSPNVAEDHQTINAKALVAHDAALMIRDEQVKQELFTTAFELVKDVDRCQQLSANIQAMAHENAAIKIANEVIQLIPNFTIT